MAEFGRNIAAQEHSVGEQHFGQEREVEMRHVETGGDPVGLDKQLGGRQVVKEAVPINRREQRHKQGKQSDQKQVKHGQPVRTVGRPAETPIQG
ncbi:MAG: hypothetical protein DPW09_03325 [Anaerolineae bacterium]|nr:hypothetical protein [Anaerolineae bacterium]